MGRTELILPELSYQLNGLFFEVHNELGRFCREKQYADLFEKKLKLNGISYMREKELPIAIPAGAMGGNKVDFAIKGKVLVDFKAKPFITKADYYQMLRYLDAAKVKLGFIVNFRRKFLRPKRVLNSRLTQSSASFAD